MAGESYPPIADYGYIADCHAAALISKTGSIDWCCLPRFDSGSCFGRLLDWQQGGYCQIFPSVAYRTSRQYLRDSLILETTFATAEGKVRLRDCFTMRPGGAHDPYRQILRRLEGIEGVVPVHVEIVPRFDLGSTRPWIRRLNQGVHTVIGGNNGLVISGDFPVQMKHRHDLGGALAVRAGQHYHLSLEWRWPEDLDADAVEAPDSRELDHRLQQTIDWWHTWSSRFTFAGRYADYALRSALVLKGLINAPTGAMVAAPTTSLPEAPGGQRNWDYRYSWVRDSAFAVDSLAEVGYTAEADGFRRFVERSSAGAADQLQILYGVGGERQIAEMPVGYLEGYRGARPVRVGNAAWQQVQLDVYGEVLELTWQWHARGHSPDDDYWEFLLTLIARTCEKWRDPDRGIWEMRGAARHFVLSKVMCWAVLDRGIRLAEELGRDAPLAAWKSARTEIRREVERSGYDHRRGVFVQAFDHRVMDAGLLLVPTVGFVAYDDERMVRTTDAIQADLGEDGFLRRYPAGEDDLEEREGVFLPCSFWLARCLTHQQRTDEARAVFEHALSAGNDLRLFSEEFDPRRGEMRGNFPQGLTHLSLIAAAVALAKAS